LLRAGWPVGTPAGLQAEPVRADLAVMAIYTEPQIAMWAGWPTAGGALHKVRVPFSTSCVRT